MAIRRRAGVRIRGRQAAAAFLLVLLLVPEAALAVGRGAEHGCACRGDACPVRPAAVKPPPPSCHDALGHPVPPPAAAARSLHAACPCGLPHSPAAPHRELRAVPETVTAALSLPPAGAVARRPVPRPLSHLSVPESPPPRSSVLPR